MHAQQKEALVKHLYETYPYPSREVTTTEITYFAEWVARTFGETTAFWKGKKILELGCGTGELACALALCGAQVTAIDFSHASISKARALARTLAVTKKTTFIEKNILHLQPDAFDTGKKNTFDCVIALGSLHHTVDALKGFRIGCTFARPQGLVIIGLYNTYARLRHRIKRSFLRLLAGNDIEKRMTLGTQLFATPQDKKRGKAWAADKYGQVHESYHSVGEVLHWFHSEGIEFIASKPTFEHAIISELQWLLEKRGAFFVMTGRKQKA